VKGITIEELLRVKADALELELLNEGCHLGRRIAESNVSSPGLVLAGFRGRLPRGRLQVLGETEMTSLYGLEESRLRDVLDGFFALPIAGAVITKAQAAPAIMAELASRHGVPLLRSSLKTGDFYRRIQPYLEERFAPSMIVHGSLADVYGVGLMFTGPSGIGKSECVLDLVERGHRLVADDVVTVTRRGNDVLIGRGHELQQHHMEIRGIGIIDIKALFGIRAIRQQKRIEVVVQLEEWSEGASYDRTGLDTDHVDYLGVKVPKVRLPLNPGKNLTVICEVVAMNHLLKYSGIDSAEHFNERLKNAMQPVRDYLEEDYE
jgi:HPr kinase/phosphorylase